MDMEQKVNDGRLEADHRRLDYRNFTDDEEVTLLPHKRDTDVPDNPVSDVCDGPDMLDTQREASPWGSSKAERKGATSGDQ